MADTKSEKPKSYMSKDSTLDVVYENQQYKTISAIRVLLTKDIKACLLGYLDHPNPHTRIAFAQAIKREINRHTDSNALLNVLEWHLNCPSLTNITNPKPQKPITKIKEFKTKLKLGVNDTRQWYDDTHAQTYTFSKNLEYPMNCPWVTVFSFTGKEYTGHRDIIGCSTRKEARRIYKCLKHPFGSKEAPIWPKGYDDPQY